jgi:outer membrane autotransporter protein
MFMVRFDRRYAVCLLLAAGMLVPAAASAQSIQEKAFYDTLFAKCNSLTSINDPLFPVCNKFLVGGLANGVYTPGGTVANVGTSGSYAGSGLQGQRDLDSVLGDEEAKKRKKLGGNSGDFTAGPFGGFITAQRSHTHRALTDLENGYGSKLGGLLVGLDRRFGNELITGLTVGTTDTDSVYFNKAGTMSARNTTAMLYSTWLPTPGAYLGAYFGAGQGHMDATRSISVGLISGLASSSTRTHQMLGGVSGGYDWYLGAATIGLTAAVDSVRNRTDATTETGNTGLEFAYPQMKTSSLAGSLGARASYRISWSSGAIVPSLRGAYVHEYMDNQRTISPSLVISPTTVFSFTTDAPDRDYYVGGVGATMELGRQVQLFVDYEKRSGHRFIQTWATSAGLIVEF